MRALVAAILTALSLAACATPPVAVPPSQPATARQPSTPLSRAEQAALNFVTVVEQVEPVAEAECRALTKGIPCDFTILVDDRPGQPPNAFQTVDRRGRPIIGFTLALIAEAQNQDELAFILGHEAAHHLAGHLALTEASAEAGARIAGELAAARGSSVEAVQIAVALGAEIGARAFSKEFELEADAIGARIAARAGFDPVHGAAYFMRIPDPGNEFLGTHPPNADRIATVRAAVAGLQGAH